MKLTFNKFHSFSNKKKLEEIRDLPKYYKFPENRLEGKFYDSTKDFFIVATDELKDSRFKNTVIVMLDHDKNGALGVVINKPLGKFSVDALIKNLDEKNIKKKIFL